MSFTNAHSHFGQFLVNARVDVRVDNTNIYKQQKQGRGQANNDRMKTGKDRQAQQRKQDLRKVRRRH